MEETVLKEYHPGAQQYFGCNRNLQQLCVDLRDPSIPAPLKVRHSLLLRLSSFFCFVVSFIAHRMCNRATPPVRSFASSAATCRARGMP